MTHQELRPGGQSVRGPQPDVQLECLRRGIWGYSGPLGPGPELTNQKAEKSRTNSEVVMSQAQIAGGSITQHNELPSRGHRLREFELMSALGRIIRLSDFRGRTNLVLIASDDRPETAKLMTDIAAQYSEIKNGEAEALAIVHTSHESAIKTKQKENLPYPVLADDNGLLHRELGAVDSKGLDSAAVYVTDRFGEVFGAYRTAAGDALPSLVDILNWIEFVNAQCPECEPPEWPA